MICQCGVVNSDRLDCMSCGSMIKPRDKKIWGVGSILVLKANTHAGQYECQPSDTLFEVLDISVRLCDNGGHEMVVTLSEVTEAPDGTFCSSVSKENEYTPWEILEQLFRDKEMSVYRLEKPYYFQPVLYTGP